MKKILCYIYNEMADFEVTLACQMIKYSGQYEVVPIAYEMTPVKSNPGLIYQCALTVEEALTLPDVEGIIIPGGWNSDQRETLTQLINKLHDEGKLVAAICAGPQYLARAGVLEHHKYTTTLTAEYLQEQGKQDPFPRQNYLQQSLVIDGNVITAVGSAFVDFAMEIADYIKMFENEEEKQACTKSFKNI